MNKIILSFVLFYLMISTTFSQNGIEKPIQKGDNLNNAQESVAIISEKTDMSKRTFSTAIPPLSHWSLEINGGFNYFRLAASTLNRTSQFHLTVGGTLEYTVNPLVGVGLEYANNPFGCTTPSTLIIGGTNDVLIYGSINLLNLLIPERSGNRKFNVYGDGGVGFAFYSFSLNHGGEQTDQSAMAKVGLNVEYALSKSFSLGVEGQYRYYNWKLEQVNTIYNTEAVTATIGIRYKFNATGEKKHVRNISMGEYDPKPAPVIIEKIVKDNSPETLNRLKELEAENATLNAKLQKINDDLQALSTKEPAAVNTSFPNIEFEFGSEKLDINAYKTLDQLAEVLIHNSSSVTLSVAGYTDYIGSSQFNKMLSLKRAKAVKEYLLTKNVQPSRISISGYGEDNPIAPNGSVIGRQKNRRVEFIITR